MTSYLVTYQVRRKGDVGIPQGDWIDREMIVIAGDDAREAINETIDNSTNHDFRLREIKVNGRVDVIAQSLR